MRAAAAAWRRASPACTPFSGSAAIQEAGCGAIANITWTSADLQERGRLCGAVEACEASLARFLEHAGVAKYAGLALGKLRGAQDG